MLKLICAVQRSIFVGNQFFSPRHLEEVDVAQSQQQQQRGAIQHLEAPQAARATSHWEVRYSEESFAVFLVTPSALRG
jgi:hypothetical protein